MRACLALLAALSGCWFDWHRYDALDAAVANPAATPLVAGTRHACALWNGEAYCWGDNTSGQLGSQPPAAGAPLATGLPTVLSPTPLPVPLPQGELAVAIAAGDAHTCAVSSTGHAYCWGSNSNGQLGTGTAVDHFAPGRVASLPDGVVQIGAGVAFTCALATSSDGGAVYCWGLNNLHQVGPTGLLGSGGVLVPQRVTFSTAGPSGVDAGGATINAPSFGDPIVQLAVGGRHACALLRAGEVWCWGDDGYDQLGQARAGGASEPVPVQGLAGPATSIALGAAHSCAQIAGAAVDLECWGYNATRQVTGQEAGVAAQPVSPTATDTSVPTGSPMALGVGHSCVLVRGTPHCWGDAAANELPPATGATIADATSVAAGDGFTCVARARPAGGDGAPSIQCWGDDRYGQVGVARRFWSATPVRVDARPAGDAGWVDLDLGASHSCAVDATGAVHCWGRNTEGELGAGPGPDRSTMVDVAYQGTPRQVVLAVEPHGGGGLATGGNTACVIAPGLGPSLVCWGSDARDAAGLDGASVLEPTTVLPVGGTGTAPASLANVALGTAFGCVTARASVAGLYQLRCWGDDTWRQVYAAPTQTCSGVLCVPVPTATDVTSVAPMRAALGNDFGCAIVDATVHCWGHGSVGQTGVGTTSRFDSVDVHAVDPATSVIAAGGGFACVVDRGNVLCWGDNRYGQVGGATGCASSVCTWPASSVLTSATSVALGANHGCALTTGTTTPSLACWGANLFGQTGSQLPQEVVAQTTVALPGATLDATARIALGQAHSCVLLASGIWCWGDNREGQLGDGSELYPSDAPPFALVANDAGVDGGS